MKIVQELKWKSFSLVVNADEDGEDDAQNIAKKLTMAAIQKGLCVLIDDGDEDGEIIKLLRLLSVIIIKRGSVVIIKRRSVIRNEFRIIIIIKLINQQ